ncbi:hypothetical protein CIB84_006400, partial [Bambusicola thoracicus]
LLHADKRREYLYQLQEFVVTDNSRNWRFRYELAEQLILILELYNPNDVYDYLRHIALTLCSDKVSEVRWISFKLVVAILQKFYANNANALGLNFINELVVRFRHCSKWVGRQAFAFICQAVVEEECMPVDQFVEHLLPSLLSLASDPVPNVRVLLAKALRQTLLEKVDLPDDSTFMDNDIVPGGTITTRIWRQDGWGHLVAAAAKGDTLKLAQLGVTEEYAGTSPHAKILGPEQKKEWVAHRAFVALFVASHRGHVNTVKFLLSHGRECIQPISSGVDLKTIKTALAKCNKFDIKVGADVHSKTPLGRTTLHVAAVMGRCECIKVLVSFGARALDPDCEGQTAVRLAQRWGQKQSKHALMRVPWQPAGARPQHRRGAAQQARGQPA